MKKIASLMVLTLLLLALYASFALDREEEGEGPAPPLRHVAAEGRVEARPGYDVRVGSDLDARIARIFVDEGKSVRKGETVVQLENSDILARLKEAEEDLGVALSRLEEIRSGPRPEEIRRAAAALKAAGAARDWARKEYARHKELHGRGMVPLSALDEREQGWRTAAARYDQAKEESALVVKGERPETIKVQEAAVARARATVGYHRALLDKTTIEAPISGVVTERFLDDGESVTPELPILAIVDMDRLWINAEVDETDVGRFAIGDPVIVTSGAFPDRVWEGRVARIAEVVGGREQHPDNPAINLGLKVIQTKIELAGRTPLRVGMTVDVRITPR